MTQGWIWSDRTPEWDRIPLHEGLEGNLAANSHDRQAVGVCYVGLRIEWSETMRGHWPLLLLVAIVLACVGLAQTPQGHLVLRDTGLYETPPTYTELAFSAPGKLPSTLTQPSTSVTVAFGIHNVTGVSRKYYWSIVLVRDGKSQTKATGTVLTPAQGRTAVTRPVMAVCVGGRIQVVVQLESPAESVSFWMTCPSAKKQVKQ